MSDTALAGLLAKALRELVRYVDERPVDDDIADDDVRALESVAYVLSQVAPEDRDRLGELLGDRFMDAIGWDEPDADDDS